MFKYFYSVDCDYLRKSLNKIYGCYTNPPPQPPLLPPQTHLPHSPTTHHKPSDTPPHNATTNPTTQPPPLPPRTHYLNPPPPLHLLEPNHTFKKISRFGLKP
ncbi:hypothetical protein Hdeb2414_s1037g00975731 [Helianthus debilis subsp. tardiflorus]